jgi:peptidoglycan/xylan/chitin deacetylase (PgdA/CDA1 family)
MKRLLRWTLMGIGAAIYVTLWPEVALPVFDTIVPGIVWRGDPKGSDIALTFDDGPDAIYTPQVLAILEHYKVPATFFLVGERAAGCSSRLKAAFSASTATGAYWHRPFLSTRSGRPRRGLSD